MRSTRLSVILLILLVFVGHGVWATPQQSEKEKRLLQAVQAGDVSKVKTLLKQGANPMETGAGVDTKDYSGGTALMIAAAMGNIQQVKVLLKGGASINAKDTDGDTALLRTLSGLPLSGPGKQSEPMIRFLLENGADVKAKNQEDKTALDIVRREQNSPAIIALIEKASQ